MFPDLVDGACADQPAHEEVRKRLAEYPLCERCFATYRRTAELCRQFARDLPSESVERLIARLRAARDG